MKQALNLVKNFNDLNTRKKLIISYILVVFIPVLLVGILLTYSLRKMAMNNAISEASINVERVSKRMQAVLEIPVTISLKLYGSSELRNIITEEYDTQWDVIKTYFNYDEFNDLMRLYNEIEDIRIYVNNNSMIDNWRFVKITEDIRNLPWFKSAVEQGGKILWTYTDVPGKTVENPSLSMIRLLKTTKEKELGVLVIKIKNDELNKILRQESFETMLADDRGVIIAAKDSGVIGKKVDSLGFSYDFTQDKQISDVNYRNSAAKAIILPFYGATTRQCFSVVSLFSVNDIVSNANRTSILGFVIITLSLIMSFILILVFSNVLSGRIDRISKDIHKVALGNFDFIKIDGKDEVGQLAEDLNIMIESIKNLLSEVNEISMQKNSLLVKQREIKLKMLANQINPHFLFNALEAIRMKAVSRGEKEIGRIAILLGKIMRSNLKVGSELVSLENEIDLIKSYLEIQKFRYGDKINYSIGHIEAELLQYKILPCLIQPIVENSVTHGLENKEENGRVDISVQENEKYIHIRVQDDGVGINEEKLIELYNSLDEPDDSEARRIGLRNVHQRIKLFYGNEYGLEITSKLEQGTIVNIIFPKGEGAIV
jgi:two-component system, sensor histidine kinase YesM